MGPSFFARPTLTVARELIGTRLVHETAAGTTAGTIVEVEAYIGESDPGCHAASGPTPRNAPLYGPPGVVYVYLNYGVHCLLNVVTEAETRPAAVLLRAVMPTDGLPLMRRRRRRAGVPVPNDVALCRGPGNLSKAFGVTLGHNTRPLADGPLTIRAGDGEVWPVRWTRRIGLSRGGDRFWRCAAAHHPAVSGTRAWNADAIDHPRPRRPGA